MLTMMTLAMTRTTLTRQPPLAALAPHAIFFRRLQQMRKPHLGEASRDGGLGLRAIGENSFDPHARRPHRRALVLGHCGLFDRLRLESVAVSAEGEAAADRDRAP